jgi:hypothetical protein
VAEGGVSAEIAGPQAASAQALAAKTARPANSLELLDERSLDGCAGFGLGIGVLDVCSMSLLELDGFFANVCKSVAVIC